MLRWSGPDPIVRGGSPAYQRYNGAFLVITRIFMHLQVYHIVHWCSHAVSWGFNKIHALSLKQWYAGQKKIRTSGVWCDVPAANEIRE